MDSMTCIIKKHIDRRTKQEIAYMSFHKKKNLFRESQTYDQLNLHSHRLLYQLWKPIVHDDVIKWKHFCAGNSPVTGESPAQRPMTRSFDVFFDLRLNKWLSKQSQGWWFERLSRPLWRHCYDLCESVPCHTPSIPHWMCQRFCCCVMYIVSDFIRGCIGCIFLGLFNNWLSQCLWKQSQSIWVEQAGF